jgi:hypothetical protein
LGVAATLLGLLAIAVSQAPIGISGGFDLDSR